MQKKNFNAIDRVPCAINEIRSLIPKNNRSKKTKTRLKMRNRLKELHSIADNPSNSDALKLFYDEILSLAGRTMQTPITPEMEAEEIKLMCRHHNMKKADVVRLLNMAKKNPSTVAQLKDIVPSNLKESVNLLETVVDESDKAADRAEGKKAKMTRDEMLLRLSVIAGGLGMAFTNALAGSRFTIALPVSMFSVHTGFSAARAAAFCKSNIHELPFKFINQLVKE